jgi:hypothetical protein
VGNVVTAFAVALALWPACNAADEIRRSAELTASPDVVEMTTHYVNDPRMKGWNFRFGISRITVLLLLLGRIDLLVDVRVQKTRQKLSR